MRKCKVMIADSSEEFCHAMVKVLSDTFDLQTFWTGADLFDSLQKFSPDILLLDLMMPGIDGIDFLEKVFQSGHYPKVLATTRFDSLYIRETMEHLAISYLMIKPCNIRATARRIQELSGQIGDGISVFPDLRILVTQSLILLGIPTHMRGYSYLREAILLFSRDPGQSLTKEVYPAVDKQFGCTSAQVERSIRSAIAAAWEICNHSLWTDFVGPTKSRPSNGRFISTLSDRVTLDQHISSRNNLHPTEIN